MVGVSVALHLQRRGRDKRGETPRQDAVGTDRDAKPRQRRRALRPLKLLLVHTMRQLRPVRSSASNAIARLILGG